MHLEPAPHGEVKLARLQRGAIFEVIIDRHPNSSGYQDWPGSELGADKDRNWSDFRSEFQPEQPAL